MEALLKPGCSTFSLGKYSPQERGYLTRGSPCFTAGRRMPVSYLHDINRKCNVKKSFELSALADNQGHIEKLPGEKNMLGNEISSKHEDSNAIFLKKLQTFAKFARPYAMMGIVSGVLSTSLLPIRSIADFSHPAFFMGMVQALALGGLLQLYMIAVNDLFDVKIDKINKQHFAMASGEFSQGDVVAICLGVTVLSIGIVYMSKSPALLCALIVNHVVSTGYSADLPFLRWKRHPLLTLPSMALWCALGIHIPHFIHIQKYVLGRPNLFTKLLIFQTVILCMNTTAGLILKDVPDVDGDRANGIETLSTQFGVERAFAIGVNVLFAQFGLGMVVGASSSLWFGKLIAVLGHLALALVVWYRSRHTDATNKSSAQSFYMLAWQFTIGDLLVISWAVMGSLLIAMPKVESQGRLKFSFTCFFCLVPVSYLHDINRKCNVKKSFELSALADNQGHIEKLPNEKNMFENEISSKHEDSYAIFLKKLQTFAKFARPYAMMGIVSGVLSTSLMPIRSIADFSHPTIFMGMVQALALGGLLQLYMIAVNDLFDVKIDKINKQHFAMASGEFSQGDVVAICLAVTVLSIVIVFMSKSPALLCALIVNHVVSTGYSADLPFLRWKRHPLLTLPSMVLWCALGIHIPHFIQIQKYVLGRPKLFTKLLIFQTVILCMNTTAGLILKDVPDVEGDRANGIETISTQFGVEKAFAIGVNVLYAQFVLGMVVGASSSLWFGKLIAVLGQLALALVVWYRSRHTDPTNKSSAQSFYMLAWQVMCVEYLLFHFVR